MVWIILSLILILLLFIIFVLLSSISITVMYKEELIIKIKILCFTFTLFDSSKKSKAVLVANNSKKPLSKIKNKTNKLKKIGVIGSLKSLSAAFKTYANLVKEILEIIIIDELTFILRVGGSDATKVALSYGQACTGVYSILGYISSVKSPKIYHVLVSPDFCSEKVNVEFKLSITTKILKILKSLSKLKKIDL